MAMITNAAHPETFIHAGMESPTRTLSFVSSILFTFVVIKVCLIDWDMSFAKRMFDISIFSISLSSLTGIAEISSNYSDNCGICVIWALN